MGAADLHVKLATESLDFPSGGTESVDEESCAVGVDDEKDPGSRDPCHTNWAASSGNAHTNLQSEAVAVRGQSVLLVRL